MYKAKDRKSAERYFRKHFERAETDPANVADRERIECAESLFVAMQRAGKSPAQLAKALDRPKSYVTGLLNGSESSATEQLAAIGKALGCTIEVRFVPIEPPKTNGEQPASLISRLDRQRLLLGRHDLRSDIRYHGDVMLSAIKLGQIEQSGTHARECARAAKEYLGIGEMLGILDSNPAF